MRRWLPLLLLWLVAVPGLWAGGGWPAEDPGSGIHVGGCAVENAGFYPGNDALSPGLHWGCNPVLATTAPGNKEEGLLFARARYFSPTLGRWISRDPAGYVDGYSLYNGYFVPNAVDPTGEFLLAIVFLTIAVDLDIQANAANGDIRNINLAQTVNSAATTLLFGSLFRGFGALPYGNALALGASGALAAKQMQDTALYLTELIAQSDDAFNDPEIKNELKRMAAQALRDVLLAVVTSKYKAAPPSSFKRASQSVCPPKNQSGGALVVTPDFASKQLALDHYAKHARGVEIKRDIATGKIKQVKPKKGGADMPEVKNFDDYQTKAKQMWTRNTSSTLEERASGSDRLRYDHETGLFSVLSGGGKIRTCFRPDTGYQYFLTNTD